jgi:HSP20 family protein
MANTPVEVKKSGVPQTQGTDPWRSLRGEMDRLFDRFAGSFGMPSIGRLFDVTPFWQSETSLAFATPAVEITEDDRAFKIALEVPGMTEKESDVSVNGDVIVFTGEKRQEREEKGKSRYVSERSYGSFQRSFELPSGIDRDKIAANMASGVLTVTLPKTAEAQKQQKKIEVKAA